MQRRQMKGLQIPKLPTMIAKFLIMTSYHIWKSLIGKAFLVQETHPPNHRSLWWKRLNLGSLLPTAPTDVWSFATAFCPVKVKASTKMAGLSPHPMFLGSHYLHQGTQLNVSGNDSINGSSYGGEMRQDKMRQQVLSQKELHTAMRKCSGR